MQLVLHWVIIDVYKMNSKCNQQTQHSVNIYTFTIQSRIRVQQSSISHSANCRTQIYTIYNTRHPLRGLLVCTDYAIIYMTFLTPPQLSHTIPSHICLTTRTTYEQVVARARTFGTVYTVYIRQTGATKQIGERL